MKIKYISYNLPWDTSLALFALNRRDEEFTVPLLCCAPDVVVVCVRPDTYGLFEREREDVFVFVIGEDERPEEFLFPDGDEQEGLFERVLLLARRLFVVVAVVGCEEVDGKFNVHVLRISLSVPLTISIN